MFATIPSRPSSEELKGRLDQSFRHRRSSADSPDMVRQYRKLDDQIITRLNRANAQLRDQNRVGGIAGGSSRGYGSSSIVSDPAARDGIEGMCTRMWSEMMCESCLYIHSHTYPSLSGEDLDRYSEPEVGESGRRDR